MLKGELVSGGAQSVLVTIEESIALGVRQGGAVTGKAKAGQSAVAG